MKTYPLYYLTLILTLYLPQWFRIGGLIGFSSLGFIQFFFRVSDTNFYKVIGKCCEKVFCCKNNELLSDTTTVDRTKSGVSFFILFVI